MQPTLSWAHYWNQENTLSKKKNSIWNQENTLKKSQENRKKKGGDPLAPKFLQEIKWVYPVMYSCWHAFREYKYNNLRSSRDAIKGCSLGWSRLLIN